MDTDTRTVLIWNQEATPLYPSGTTARAGDLWFTIKRSKTQHPKWRLYLEICTHKKHGVEDDIKRGVLVAAYPGTLTLKDVQVKAEEYLLLFIGNILLDLQGKEMVI